MDDYCPEGALSYGMVMKYYNMTFHGRMHHPLADTPFYLVVTSDGTMIPNLFKRFSFNSYDRGHYFQNYWFAYAYQLRIKQRLRERENA